MTRKVIVSHLEGYRLLYLEGFNGFQQTHKANLGVVLCHDSEIPHFSHN